VFEEGFRKIFLCFNLYLLFVLKKNFEAKRLFGKEFYTDKIKEGFLLSLLGLEVQTVYKKNFKKI